MQNKKEIQRDVNLLIKFNIILSVSMLLLCGCGKKEPTFLLQESEMATIEEMISERSTTPPESRGSDNAEDDSAVTQTQNAAQSCFVHICGAVRNPGVYELPTGSRIYDAILLAGGLQEDASDAYQNQAEVVTDGMQIYIPTKAEVQQAGEDNMPTLQRQSASANLQVQHAENGGMSGLVNINTADMAQLMTLSGIGESRAKSIIAYREKHGFFSTKEDIMKVSGIKEGAYEKIKDSICVN